MLVDEKGVLTGLFTDSDLARLLENRRDANIDGPVGDVMTHSPTTAFSGTLLLDAIQVMAERKISELPVVDAGGCPVGLIDVTDVVGLLPADALSADSNQPSRLGGVDGPPTVPLAG